MEIQSTNSFSSVFDRKTIPLDIPLKDLPKDAKYIYYSIDSYYSYPDSDDIISFFILDLKTSR